MPTIRNVRSWFWPLLLTLTGIAIGAVAIVWASEWWQAVVMSVTGCTLIAAMLLAAYREGARRAFWCGFAVSTAVYVLISIYFGFGGNLPTGKLLDVGISVLETNYGGSAEIQSRVIERPVEETNMQTGIITIRTVYEYVQGRDPRERSWRMTIGHCLWSVLLGLVGGGFARRIYVVSDKPWVAKTVATSGRVG